MTTTAAGLPLELVTKAFGLLLLLSLPAMAETRARSTFTSKALVPLYAFASDQRNVDRHTLLADRIPLQVSEPDDLDVYYPRSRGLLAQAPHGDGALDVIFITLASRSRNIAVLR